MLKLATNDRCSYFMFNETMHVRCSIADAVQSLETGNYLSYTSSVEMRLTNSKRERFPSTLSGSILSLDRAVIHGIAETGLKVAASNFPVVDHCHCVADVLLYNSLLRFNGGHQTWSSLRRDAIYTVHKMVTFCNVEDMFDYKRIFTSGFRYISSRDRHLKWHSVGDRRCKVALVTDTTSQVLILIPLVKHLAVVAAKANRELAKLRYRVYVIDHTRGTGKCKRTVNGVRVRYSSLDTIAAKSKYVVFVSSNTLPLLEFFMDISWMEVPYTYYTHGERPCAGDDRIVNGMIDLCDQMVISEDPSWKRSPDLPYDLHEAVKPSEYVQLAATVPPLDAVESREGKGGD